MFINVSIEIPRMFSLVMGARGLEIKSDEARRGLHAGSLNYNRLRRVKRYAREREHGSSLLRIEIETHRAGISQFEAVLVAIVPWTLTSLLPGNSSFNSLFIILMS